MRRVEVDEQEIIRLYNDEGLRAQAIADHLGTTTALVYERLERAGVVRSRAARLPLDVVIRLYVDEGWPATKIGEKFGVGPGTVRRHLRNAGIQLRGPTAAQQLPGRTPCPKSLTFRSYLLGLVWGDFSVERVTPKGTTLVVKTSTTRGEQARLAERVLGPFGPVRFASKTLRASVDLSFLFLFDKYGWDVPAWVSGLDARSAFAAGYVDAEGSLGVYEGRGRFKVDSYDVGVLHWFHQWCDEIGVRSKLRRVACSGEARPDGTSFRKDLWRVQVNEGRSLLWLVATLEPFARHEQRQAAMFAVRQNILDRCRSRDPDRTLPVLRGDQPRGPREVDAG